MSKKIKSESFLLFLIVFMFCYSIFCTSILAASNGPFSDVQEKLQGISDEEKQVLQKLFSMEQDIENMKQEENALNIEIESLNKEVYGLDAAIKKEEDAYNKKRDALKQVLLTYQKRGPASFIEIILDSKDLNMFLWRISALQDLSRNTSKLLNSLSESKTELAKKKADLQNTLSSIEDKRKKLKETIDKEMLLKDDQEKYLASLKYEKGYYQEKLDSLNKAWNDLVKLFSDAEAEFSEIINEQNSISEYIKISFTQYGIEGSIDESSFNEFAKNTGRLSSINFKFYPGRINISVPDMELSISGRFDISDGSTLVFKADEGTFYGIELDSDSISKLFKNGGLFLDLKPVIFGGRLDSIEISDGRLKFKIK